MRILILSSGNVATATLNRQFNLELALLIERCQMKVRVVDFHACRRSDIPCDDLTGASLAQVHHDRLILFRGQNDVFDVQDDLSDVFLHAFHRVEFVWHTVNADRGDRCARNGRQQCTAQGVTQCVSKPRLEWLKSETGAVIAHLLL